MKGLIWLAVIAGIIYFIYTKADWVKDNTTGPMNEKYDKGIETRTNPDSVK